MPKKIVQLSISLLGLWLSVILLTACGNEIATPTPVTSAAANSARKLKVGFITERGPVNDKGYNQAVWEGLQKAQKELGVELKFVETADIKDYDKNFKQLLDEKTDILVTSGTQIVDATLATAKANPSVQFISVDLVVTPDKELKNLATLVFEEDKAGFLAGVLAAGMSQSGKIGAVLGPQSIPQLLYFGEGYKAGAEWLAANHKNLVKATPQVSLTYHPGSSANPFNDAPWGIQQAQSLVRNGNDVLFGAAGATGTVAIETAAGQGIYVIGVDTDQYLTLPKTAPKLLSSALKLIGDGVFSQIKNIQSGTFKSGNNLGSVGLAPFHDLEASVSPELKEVLKKVETGLKDGSIKTGVKK